MKKSPLTLFIVLYLLIWVGLTLLIHSKTSISPDTVENIMWGMNPSLMYDKHPGLGALFFRPFVMVFSPLAADLIAVAICMLVTWLFIYKISKIYFEPREAIFITLLSVLSFFYMGEFFIQYNQNIILLPFWTSSAYFFIKAINTNKRLYWFVTAILVALGVYAKFQIALLGFAMFLYLIVNYKCEYTKNIMLSAVIGTCLLIPGLISLYNIDFKTITYASDRVQEADTDMLFNFFYGIFDSVFQLLNLVVGIVVILYLGIRKKITRHQEKLSNAHKAIIYLGFIPYIIFFILEIINGQLPTEWLVCSSSLLLISIYILLRIKLKEVSLNKIVALGIFINLVFFIAFNLNTFANDNIEHNNIGANIAITADKLIKENNLPYPEYASGAWNYSLYLTVFMNDHPKFIRQWFKLKSKGTMLIVYPGCNDIIDIKSVGYKLLYKKCTKVKLIDKFKTQYEPFLFYIVEKS